MTRPLDPLPDETLAELERLDRESCPEPWRQHERGLSILTSQSHPLATLSDPGHRQILDARGRVRAGDDAALIVAMRNALPSLLAEVRAARDRERERVAANAAPCKTCGHQAGYHARGVELPVGCTVIGCDCGRAARAGRDATPDAEVARLIAEMDALAEGIAERERGFACYAAYGPGCDGQCETTARKIGNRLADLRSALAGRDHG